jgi:hypothetical protein
MEVWKNIYGLFQRNESMDLPQLDPTNYEIEARIGKYSGNIAYQDSVIIKPQNFCTKKPIKIMKENTVRICIVN